MDLIDLLLGRPLASKEARAEKIGPVAGIPIFGLDALSSAAYGPEAALTLLIPLGAAGISYILPVTFSIVVLLTIVYFSYRQTITAYPGGGGSYTVARENLGANAGLLAAAALLIDYVLTVAVGISAGVGALVSAAPNLQKYTLGMCLGILVLIVIVNLRGVREAGVIFMIPTYMFVGSLLALIAIGLVKSLLSGGHPHAVIAAAPMAAPTTSVSPWLLLTVFASGCTAMTGVEAVSNGVSAFREPTARNAQRTLTIIIVLLIVLLAGIAYLASAYGIGATDPTQPGYQSVLSMMLVAVTGRGWFYYVSIFSILLVLCLSANTAFADFPRLCRIIALDGFLPHGFQTVGRRLVFTQGIIVLAALSALLLTIFGGVTDRLIPLYAVGAFLAFTLSQAGMVVHWKRTEGGRAWSHMLINGTGALATGATVAVVLVAKFVEGAWITLLLIPAILAVMLAVQRHYRKVALEVRADGPVNLANLQTPVVVLPVHNWTRVTQEALRFVYTVSHDIRAVYVECGDDECDQFRRDWSRFAETPARNAGLPAPCLKVIASPYRRVMRPIYDYVLEVAKENPQRLIAVVVPELVKRRWYHNLMHNQRAAILKTWLLVGGNRRIVVINVPWYTEG
jgi:amino acid transporter